MIVTSSTSSLTNGGPLPPTGQNQDDASNVAPKAEKAERGQDNVSIQESQSESQPLNVTPPSQAPILRSRWRYGATSAVFWCFLLFGFAPQIVRRVAERLFQWHLPFAAFDSLPCLAGFTLWSFSLILFFFNLVVFAMISLDLFWAFGCLSFYANSRFFIGWYSPRFPSVPLGPWYPTLQP